MKCQQAEDGFNRWPYPPNYYLPKVLYTLSCSRKLYVASTQRPPHVRWGKYYHLGVHEQVSARRAVLTHHPQCNFPFAPSDDPHDTCTVCGTVIKLNVLTAKNLVVCDFHVTLAPREIFPSQSWGRHRSQTRSVLSFR